MSIYRPNVAEQNDAFGDQIAKRTIAFRNRTAGYPTAMYEFLESRGINVSQSVLVSASTAEQGVNPVSGLILTPDMRFMDFDLDCSEDGGSIVEVHSWTDETTSQNMGSHNPGFGKGLGLIAIEVFHRLGSMH